MAAPVCELFEKSTPEVGWKEYLRIEPGEYAAYCKAARWYFEPGYKRWTCLLVFQVFSDEMFTFIGNIPMWFNGGKGKQPFVGRRSRYFPEWIRANGSPPARKDRLAPSVFVKRLAKVTISDTQGELPYSVVRSISSWNTGSSSQSVIYQQGTHVKAVQ